MSQTRVSASRPTRHVLASAALAIVATLATFAAFADGAPRTAADDPLVARGRYLVKIGGCNDCHTAGYAERAGDVPESQWLTGVALGFKGPWGVSYAANLRQKLGALSEQQWLAVARAPRLPPMPWFALRDMSEQDLRAIWHYVRALGVAGEAAPVAVAPGVEPQTPYILWQPTFPRQAAAIASGPRTASR